MMRRSSRPGVYVFARCNGGPPLEFWLLDREPATRAFLDALGQSNGLDMSQLYRTRSLWWRGMAKPPKP